MSKQTLVMSVIAFFALLGAGCAGPAGPAGPEGRPGPAGSSSAGATSGWERVSNSRVVTMPPNDGVFDQYVNCPSGKKVLGGGGEARIDHGVTGAVALSASVPTADNQWRVYFTNVKGATERDLTAATVRDVTLVAWAICANVP
jgi:hypothetical protein